MAASDVDRMLLARIAHDTSMTHPSLSKALFQVLGLSIVLSQELLAAQGLSNLMVTTRLPMNPLHHHILWLSREGLTITETSILPYCQSAVQSPRCRVMAAKLKASFHHIFCLFHNKPSIPRLARLRSPKFDIEPFLSPHLEDVPPEERSRTPKLRDPVSSATSDTSYVTNPWSFNPGPAPTPPPSIPLPPVPSTPIAREKTPLFPPGFEIAGLLYHESPSSADYIMLPTDHIPDATRYFSEASTLAKHLLPGNDPLRLSVIYESCLFTLQLRQDPDLARETAKAALRNITKFWSSMSRTDYLVSMRMRQSLEDLIEHLDNTLASSVSSAATATPSSSGKKTRPRGVIGSPSLKGSPQKPRRQRKTEQSSPLTESSDQNVSNRGSMQHSRSQTSNASTQSNKERKRRKAELAEQNLERRKSLQTAMSMPIA